jgi:Glycosyltransferases, probably involved in cell wall biogenesis
MTLMVAGVACLVVSCLWHVCLAVLSTREASRWAAGTSAASDHVRPRDVSAAPSVLWLVLINPAPATLAAVRAVGLRLRCRTRAVVVVSDLSRHKRPDPADLHRADMHRLAVPPRFERAEVLNRAYRLIRARCREYGDDPARTVVGVIEANTVPDESLAVAVWHAFREPGVGAVQARTQIREAGGLGAAEHYDRGVLADAANLVRSRRGRAWLGVNGAFVRLSELSRLGHRPWRPGATEDHGLSARLRSLGVLIRHCPQMQVTAYGPRSVGTKASFGTTPFGIQTSFGTKASSETGRPGIARRYARAVRDRLPAWPSAGNRRREWMRWALHLAGWLLPGLIVLWVVVAYVGAASRLLLALPGPSADAPRSSTLLWMAMGLDTSSWWALPHAAGPWVGAAAAPAVVWWVARRDLTLGRLVLGALGRPMLLLARPVVFGLVVGRALLGRPATDPVGEPPAAAPLIGPDILREEPVFVDSTGRRNRRVWTVAYASGLAGLAYVVALLIALATGQIPPHAVGEGPRLDFPVPARTPPAMPQPVPIEPPVEIEQSVEGTAE